MDHYHYFQKKYFHISSVARIYDVHPQTLRLYEREGLLKPSRSEGNTRLYSDVDLKRLEFILNLTQELGVNLAGVEIILNLKKNHKFEGAVVDRFASDKTLLSSLKDLKKIKLQHRIKAEDDLAVASASIIARYLYLKKMKELSEKYEVELPKGASEKVVKTASEFVDKYGKEKLVEVAKIHFKTFQQI